MTQTEALRILKEEQQDAQALFSVSFWFEQAGRPFSALRAVERAIALNGEIPGFHARYGQLLIQRRRFKEAASAYARAAQIDPRTASFRAAQARACAGAGLLKEATEAWWRLLEGAVETRELFDAARQIETLCRQAQDSTQLERVWSTVLPKLDNWDERLYALDRISEAATLCGSPGRARESWTAAFGQEKDWERRAVLAARLASAAANQPSEERSLGLTRAAECWRTLLKSAPSPAHGQRAAVQLALGHLQERQPAQAIEVLNPARYGGDWPANLGAARLLAGCYALQGATAARQALWREFMERSTTRLTLEAGKRYAIQIAYRNNRQEEGRSLSLWWSSPSQPKQLISAANLFPSAEATQGGGLKGEYFDYQAGAPKAVRVDPLLDFRWDPRTPPAPGIHPQAFSIRWSGFVQPAFSEEYILYLRSSDRASVSWEGLQLLECSGPETAEETSLGLGRRWTAARELASSLQTVGERIGLWRDEVKAFPSAPEGRRELAETLAGAGCFAEALDEYDACLTLLRAPGRRGIEADFGYAERLLSLCLQAGDQARALQYLTRHFGDRNNPWRLQNGLQQIQNAQGFYAALDAVERLGTLGGSYRMGAARFLQYSGHPELAQPLFEACAEDRALEAPQRREALQTLLQLARTHPERVALVRRMLPLAGSQWERAQDYATLVRWLGQDGLIEEALQAVREADRIQEHHWRGGPQALQGLAGQIFQGNRVGPGLRSPAGQERAEGALLKYGSEAAGRQDLAEPLAQLACQLAELHARRGDYDGAVELLRSMAKPKDLPEYHLQIAALLERKADLEGAWKSLLDYLDREAAGYAANLRHPNAQRRSSLRGPPDHRFSTFLEQQQRYEALGRQVSHRLTTLGGLEREAYAETVLALYKGQGRPEEMAALLKSLQQLGHNLPLYRTELQWAEGAIRMKNATSQADTRMRDRLLQEVERWKQVLRQNPEDYAAALNVHKNYQLLGRGKDAEPFLEQARQVAPADPLVLDLWGSQRMLEKDYAGAAQAFAKAGAVSGRPEDFEKSVLSAYELAGRSKEALELALDSLASGRFGGRGVRTVEEILDLGERSAQLPFLYERVAARLQALRAEKRIVREGLAQLALRLAWDQNDEPLSTAALAELIALSHNPLAPWQEEWRLRQLAQRAAERRRIPDAARLYRAMLDAALGRGEAPDPQQHRQLALLLLEAGRAAEAASLLFDGMDRALRIAACGAWTPAPQVSGDFRGSRSRRGRPAPQLATPQGEDAGRTWTALLLALAAQEGHAGGKEFRAACGKRLEALLEAEAVRLEREPSSYSGPLLETRVEEVFRLRERIDAAFRKSAEQADAGPAALLAWARRLVTLATRQPAEARDPSVGLEAIRRCCASALERTPSRDRHQARETIANLYAALLALPEKERLAGVTPALVLEVYEACVEEKRQAPESLARALALAEAHREYVRAAGYGRQLLRLFPGDRQNRQHLARLLLFASQPKEAADLLREGLGQTAGYREYLEAGTLCLLQPPAARPAEPASLAGPLQSKPAVAATRAAPEAAAAAVEFLGRALACYLEEVGPQLDAKGLPLPDPELGRVQAQLARACAWSGKLEEALNQLLASAFHGGEAPLDTQGLTAVAEMFAQAQRLGELTRLLEAKIAAAPKAAALRLAQATALEQAGDWKGAAAALRAAKALDPRLETVKRLVAALRKAGDGSSAREECREWVSSFPRDGEAYRTLAEICKEGNDTQGELRALSMLVEVAPRDAENCRSVAVLFAGRKEYPRAIALLERAIELRGEEPYRHVDLAEVLFLSGQTERAQAILAEALSRDWEKGLSPELLARMPRWQGTFEARAESLLAEICEALRQPEAAARARLKVPAGYRRPALAAAVPAPVPQAWAWLGGRGRGPRQEWVEE